METKEQQYVELDGFKFKFDGRPGRHLSAVVNMSNPIVIPEREIGGIHQIKWDPQTRSFAYESSNSPHFGRYEGSRVSDQVCVEVGGFEEDIRSYEAAMKALLIQGRDKFDADAYELTGLMSYRWKENTILEGKEGDHIGFASGIFYRR